MLVLSSERSPGPAVFRALPKNTVVVIASTSSVIPLRVTSSTRSQISWALSPFFHLCFADLAFNNPIFIIFPGIVSVSRHTCMQQQSRRLARSTLLLVYDSTNRMPEPCVTGSVLMLSAEHSSPHSSDSPVLSDFSPCWHPCSQFSRTKFACFHSHGSSRVLVPCESNSLCLLPVCTLI